MVCTVALNPVMCREQDAHSLAALVSSVARGDEAALAHLYDRTSRVVYGLALRVLDDPSTAEDITLEVYMQVWRTAESYDGGRGTVLAWLVTLARSRAIDWLRARRSRGQGMEFPLDDVSGLYDPLPDPEAATVEAARARLVRDAMAELSPDQRRMIQLAYFSGMSHSEIAERTQLPLGTVKTRIRLGMSRLRELMGPYAEGL